MEAADAELLTSFLLPMLHYYPDSRATAAEMVKHPWLDGVVVQGELEMAEKMHVAEVERLRALQAGGAGASAGAGTGEAKEQDKVSMEDVIKLGPAVKGMVGMGRI